MTEYLRVADMSVSDSVFFWLQKGQPVLLGAQSASEFCYFCKKRVYIMERQAAEGVFFHRHCLKCDYCSVGLRLNNYSCERPQGEGGEQRHSSCESTNDNNDSNSSGSSEEPLIRYHLNGRPLLFFLLLSLSLFFFSKLDFFQKPFSPSPFSIDSLSFRTIYNLSQ